MGSEVLVVSCTLVFCCCRLLGCRGGLWVVIYMYGCHGRADKSSDASVQQSVGRIPVVTLVSLSKTLNYNCFSPPRGKWVPVRAEMVLVVGLA